MARAHGRSYRAVLAEPYAWTLEAFCQLLEDERIDRFLTRSDALASGHLQALAFHDPEKLQGEWNRLREDAGFGPSPEEFNAAVAEMIAATQRLDAMQGGADG